MPKSDPRRKNSGSPMEHSGSGDASTSGRKPTLRESVTQSYEKRVKARSASGSTTHQTVNFNVTAVKEKVAAPTVPMKPAPSSADALTLTLREFMTKDEVQDTDQRPIL